MYATTSTHSPFYLPPYRAAAPVVKCSLSSEVHLLKSVKHGNLHIACLPGTNVFIQDAEASAHFMVRSQEMVACTRVWRLTP